MQIGRRSRGFTPWGSTGDNRYRVSPDVGLPCACLANRNREKDHVMKLSARNQLKGTIVDVTKGATTSHIRIDIGGGVIVTASITNEAVEDLKLAKGKPAIAVIKASDVMVGVD
jgi:molybdopterin-binding protein